MRNLAEIFKALSDETRLQMLALLHRRGELCVCDFVQVMGITQSKASRHLRYLAHAGLVLDRRATVWVYYRLHPEPGAAAGAVAAALKPILASADLRDLERRLDEWEAAKRQIACRGPECGTEAEA